MTDIAADNGLCDAKRLQTPHVFLQVNNQRPFPCAIDAFSYLLKAKLDVAKQREKLIKYLL